MGDSDDEYDRKRRDKFRGERGSGVGGGGAGADNFRGADRRDDRGRGREEWADRGRARPDYRDYRGGGGGGGGVGRDRFSPDRGGPAKRMRPDWGEDGRPRFGGHDPYGPFGGGGGGGSWGGHHEFAMHAGHGAFGGHQGMHQRAAVGPDAQANGDLQTQPPMQTLKQFLSNQDDSISDSEAINKYNDYKQDFRRQQLNEFFVTHKDEEWFKIKYHPQESLKRKEEQLNFLKRRAEVFNELLQNETVASVNVDTTQTDKLLHMLDTVVIKLEGGSDEDLKVLDEKPVELRPMDVVYNTKVATFAHVATPTDAPNSAVPTPKRSSPRDDRKSDDENWDNEEVAADAEVSSSSPQKKNPFAQKNEESTDGSAASPTKNSNNPFARKNSEDAETAKPKSETGGHSDDEEDRKGNDEDEAPKSPSNKDDEEEIEAGEKATNKRKRSQSESSSSSSSSSDSDDDNKTDEVKEEKVSDAATEKSTDNNGDVEMKAGDAEKGDEDKVETKSSAEAETEEKKEDAPVEMETIDLVKDVDEKPKLRALHRTSSVFLRNLAPTITKSEVEAMCKRYNGFLRVAIADPLVERRWFRRGWVTFQRDVNIKEICWNLNNIRLRDCELGAIVNRDLSRRVRPINGITAHKTIVRTDIKLCAKIAYNLDTKAGLWTQEDETSAGGNGTTATFGLNSNNPVLQNITDYLIEEASAEEDELLGLSGGEVAETEGELLDRDQALITVLDKLILYLRVVHSIDFYNHCEYPYEDEMPNRCGIIHARGPAPQNKVTQTEIQEYTRNFEGKMSSFLSKSQPIEETELKKLGCKDTDDEVEKFVAANTQELGKDKWLCPLSGKKFKGPDYIRKHIFNKHGEKVDEVKKEVEYFNNYLQDPKRPQLPEHPGNSRKMVPEMQQQHPGFRPGAYHLPVYAAPYVGYAPPMVAAPRARGGGFGGRRGGGGGGEYRPVIHYRDLDAPREPEDFV